MDQDFIEDTKFEGIDYSEQPLPAREYENCTFKHCIFKDVDLSGRKFTGCTFDHCDLSMADLKNTAFQEVIFSNCKLMGLRFDECRQFLLALNFRDCLLNFSSFFKLKMKNTEFKNCTLQEVEFIGTDLTEANFESCDLLGAVFENTILVKADFRSSVHYHIDPENNRIGRARFSISGLPGLLDKYDIVVE